MKKILLVLVAFVATVTASAQGEGWSKNFTPVKEKADLAGVHTAVASDGSVYASSTINQSLQFGSTTIEPEGGLLSSCVVKYDKDGVEQWAVLLYGSSTITAMVTDSDGILYVAGTFQDTALDLIGTDGDGNKKTVTGSANIISAFVAKIAADGKALAIKAISSEPNTWVSSLMIPDPWDFESETPAMVPAYSPYDPIEVTPQCLKVDGGHVYVGVMYSGNVTELGWEGRYWTDDFGSYYDALSAGVFSLIKDDLSSPTSLCNVGSTEKGNSEESITYNIYEPDDIDFMVNYGNVFVAFFGHGDLTLTTATDSKSFSFDKATSYDVNDEHALVLSLLGDIQNNTLQFRTPSLANLSYSARFRIADMELVGSNIYLAGTFAGQFAIDNTKYSVSTGTGEDTKYLPSSFVASLSAKNMKWDWSVVNTNETEGSVGTCMIVTGEEIHASTDKATYVFKTANGELKPDQTMNQSFNDADCYNDQYVSTIYTDGTNVVVFSPHMNPSGIEAIKAIKSGAAKIYNVNGVELSAPQKGLNIIKTAEGTKKMMK